MKKFIPIFFLAISVTCIGQVSIVNEDVKNPDSAVLFSGYPNHISIEGVEDMSKIMMSAENGMIIITGGGRFIVKNMSSDPVRLNVLDFSTDQQKIVLTKVFSVQELGKPLVKFVKKTDTTFSNGQRINRSRLVVGFPNLNFGGNYEVAHFELTIITKAGNTIIKNQFVSGQNLGLKLTDLIGSLKGGCTLLFDQIVLKGYDTEYSKYNSFKLKIK